MVDKILGEWIAWTFAEVALIRVNGLQSLIQHFNEERRRSPLDKIPFILFYFILYDSALLEIMNVISI